MSHLSELDNLVGLPSVDSRPMDRIMTEQGPIYIGRGNTTDISFTPTISQLDLLPLLDTRRTAISDRYYR